MVTLLYCLINNKQALLLKISVHILIHINQDQ